MGELQIILGCMYAGKTEELMRRVRREHIAGRKVLVFKPGIDQRYSATHITSHNQAKLEAIPVKNVPEIAAHVQKHRPSVIGIDEVQFFTDDILAFCLSLVQDKNAKVKIILGGLSKDFRGEPFKFVNSHRHVGELLPHASNVSILRAICTHKENGTICGRSADYSQRFIDGKPASYDSPTILVGSTEAYEARCSRHHEVPGRRELLRYLDKPL